MICTERERRKHTLFERSRWLLDHELGWCLNCEVLEFSLAEVTVGPSDISISAEARRVIVFQQCVLTPKLYLWQLEGATLRTA